MKKVDFLVGSWEGSQTFITPNATFNGKATDHAEWAVGGRFVEERLSTTLPGRPATDTRHMLAFDPKTGTYRAYWFNDTSPLPMELTGTLEGSKLTLTTGGEGSGPVLRFTYTGTAPDKLTLTFEMKQGETWTLLFHTDYTRAK